MMKGSGVTLISPRNGQSSATISHHDQRERGCEGDGHRHMHTEVLAAEEVGGAASDRRSENMIQQTTPTTWRPLTRRLALRSTEMKRLDISTNAAMRFPWTDRRLKVSGETAPCDHSLQHSWRSS